MLSPRMPELSALEVLVAVSGASSLNEAARVLGVSQQAVSARIAAIERQSGVTLVERTSRGSTLTPKGVVASEWASRLLALAGEMDAGLAALRTDSQTSLRLAASLTIAEYLLPAWLVALRANKSRNHQPAVSVELTITNSSAVAHHVASREADLGFIEGPTPPIGLGHRVVGHDRLVVVTTPNHPWAKRRSPLHARQLAETPLVVREQGSGTREVLAVAIKNADKDATELAPPALSLPTTAAVRSTILAGAGPGVLSELAVIDDIAAGRLLEIPVEGLDLRRELRAIWLGTTQPALGAARDLLELAVLQSSLANQSGS
jgi:DNA-binding transcriptional LysR family regulator